MTDAATTSRPTLGLLSPVTTAVVAAGRAPDEYDPGRHMMERTSSQDIREEREDLKEAVELNQSIVVDLSLDGIIRFVSPSWLDIIGTPPKTVVGKNIADLLVTDNHVFQRAIEAIRKDDSRSQNVRFSVLMGPSSILRKRHRSKDTQTISPAETGESSADELNLRMEGQGIIVNDRATGEESHTMWMVKPYVIREVTIDLPGELVESLGVGAEILARYLTSLAEEGITDASTHTRPPLVLCRICERQIASWWFEKHTELCLQEHTAERDVQFTQEALSEHRKNIVKVLDALEATSRQSRANSADPLLALPLAEYNGMPIGITQIQSTFLSGRSSPASPPARSRERPAPGFGHHRARSFAVRRPLPRIVELVLDLCDTTIEINMPAVKDVLGQAEGEVRTQSPGSESRISQVMQWQSPSSSAMEQEHGLAALCEDTTMLSMAKIDAVMRYRHILEYSERLRVEYEILVQACIQAAVDKAAKIAAGELSDSSEDQMDDLIDQIEAQSHEKSLLRDGPDYGLSDQSSPMALALRNMAEFPLSVDGISSVANSTRSSSPHGSRTPRSYIGALAPVALSKRASIHLESDAGMDSDSSMRSVAFRGGRSHSSASEVSLPRVTGSQEGKRRSLIIPHVKTSRQQSPARSMPPPSSPLRQTRNKLQGCTEASPSPMTSPIMVQHEFSSPNSSSVQLQQFHRRQSSAASSDVLGRPLSPRLQAHASNPQPQAKTLSIKDFEMIKPISKGAFGSVYLARKKATGDYFAIKALKKADMIAKNQVTNVKAERAIMMRQEESDFVAKLYWTFQNRDHLFLVMEYLNGGDCAALVKSLGGIPEEWALRYIAEVVLGVDHLHSRGIVHRDLKPDNLLIDQKGHLKLTDFGLSRMGIVRRQTRAAGSHAEEAPVPVLLKQSSVHRAVSVGSSRSASFDLHGTGSPSQSSLIELTQPSYFSLHRGSSRRPSIQSDSETSDSLQRMVKSLSLNDPEVHLQAHSAIEEENSGSTGYNSPDPYPSQSHATVGSTSAPPGPLSSILLPNLALFDPEDGTRKFVGTPDYLAPETINGVGQDELSDWWSLGCILFEFLYGYPPFHGRTPDEVFQNILHRKIDWPLEELDEVSEEAKDLMNQLMCTDPSRRLGANLDDRYASGGEEIKAHAWFAGINWDTLREDEASFIPTSDDPENTEYFDARGAVLQNFSAEFEEQSSSPVVTPGGECVHRPHDALSRVRSQVNSIKRNLIPLHIPPHVRDGRSRRLSEPVLADDFGNFNFKNLPVLEKANKDVIQKLKAEALQAQHKPTSTLSSPVLASSPNPSLDSSPILPMALKLALSSNQGINRPASPLLTSQSINSPNRCSQPPSPLLIQFSTGQHHERRKTSSSSSSLSQQISASLQPGNLFDVPKAPGGSRTGGSSISSSMKLIKSPNSYMPHERAPSASRNHHASRRSQTIEPQESEDVIKELQSKHSHHRNQASEISPSSSDTEDNRQKTQALLRVQRRRQSSRRLSQITLAEGPMFRPLDVLICEDHPVSRLVMEKLLEKLRCRTVTAANGAEAVRFATSDVKFDIILTEYKLANFTGSDLARMIRRMKNVNSTTPVVCVTSYLVELPPSHFFDGLVEKPPTIIKLSEILGRLCQWKPPPTIPKSNQTWLSHNPLGQGYTASTDDNNTPFSSSFAIAPSESYRGSSREHSISSSSFGDFDNRIDDSTWSMTKPSSYSFNDAQLAKDFEGLGICSEDSQVETDVDDCKMVFSGTLHAPTPIKAPSSEWISLKKKRSGEREAVSAESGDDEDDELGSSVQSKSLCLNRPRGSSKLGTEMMRTNSRGSVVSVDDLPLHDHGKAQLPPSIAEIPGSEEHHLGPLSPRSTPFPECNPTSPITQSMSSPKSGNSAEATPKPSHTTTLMDEQTPRPKSRRPESMTRWPN